MKKTRKSAVSGNGKSDKDLQAIYARMRRRFSAAELQKYTEVEKGVPARKVLAELEEAQRRHAKEKK